MKIQNKLRLAILLSFTLHFVLAGLLWLKPFASTPRAPKQTVEVELLDVQQLAEALNKQKNQTKDPNGQIVEQSEKALNDEVPEDARFLSRHNQRVVRETQAQLHGKFKNTDESAGKETNDRKLGKVTKESPSDDKETSKSSDDQKQILTSDNGPALKSKSLKDLTPSFKPGPPRVESQDMAEGGGKGPSATDDHIKNVATGMQTLLSTREFVYYSYYNRIKDKLRQYWEPKIKEKMERIIRQGRTIASSSDRITKIIIILDREGTLVKVQVVGPSGVHDLDEAAVEAFKAAAPFPNPPHGIVEEDGTIRIRWDFILEANAGGLLDAMRVGYKKP